MAPATCVPQRYDVQLQNTQQKKKKKWELKQQQTWRMFGNVVKVVDNQIAFLSCCCSFAVLFLLALHSPFLSLSLYIFHPFSLSFHRSM